MFYTWCYFSFNLYTSHIFLHSLLFFIISISKILLLVAVFPERNVSAHEHALWSICLVVQFSAIEFSLFTLGLEDSCEIITNVTEMIIFQNYYFFSWLISLDRTFRLFRIGSLVKSKKKEQSEDTQTPPNSQHVLGQVWKKENLKYIQIAYISTSFPNGSLYSSDY